MKLRKCVCGGYAQMYFGDHGVDLRHVYCYKCGLESLSWWNGNKAAANWNAIIMRKTAEKSLNNES